MKTTTLNKIRSFSPCKPSWKKLLNSLNKTQADDEELSFRHIYETLGTLDTIWCLRTLDDLSYCVKIAKHAADTDALDADAADDAVYAAARADAAAYARAAYAVRAYAAAATRAAIRGAEVVVVAGRADAAAYDAATRNANYDKALTDIGDHLMKLLENEK